MKPIILQVQTAIEQSSHLIDYGVLGIFALLMISVIVYQEKQRTKSNGDMNNRITVLETKLDAKQQEHDAFINGAYAKASQVIDKCVSLLEEVKELLIKRNN